MTFKTKTYESGRFDVPITISQKTATKNEYGEAVISLVTVASCWSERDYQSGREFLAGTAASEASKAVLKVAKFTFRYVDGLEEKMVIIDDEHEVYDITKIAHLNRKQYHQVIAQTIITA